ncbi:rapsynoid, putative [Pediculus humanus corporis]|uniref:Rapsynoid, putative n=1 Tax=Pediculus humanus subsp. corporis TaxID=121224 RepID=E0VK22_PEDHC|nr:rapsynoid, putative [Pediculus humanus corporis]EEB13728.1 rapsynoid, putative [Pediculus humanus corporis]
MKKVEPEGTCQLPAANKALFLEKVRQSNAACQNGDFATSVALYTDALSLDPTNHILYSNRSAALVKMGRFEQALQDAIRAKELNSQWPKAYYRQGVALQCLGRHGEALAAFSSGLAQDSSNTQLLAGLIEAAMKSPMKSTLEPIFDQLEAMKLDKSPFVIISVIGQELLGAAQYASAVIVLEAALRIGTCSLKLRGSVFSALRSAYFSKGSFKEALTSHRYQLVLAMKCKDTQAAASALTSLGHVYTAIGDYPNALASHKQCVQLVKQMGDRLQEAREIGNVGAVYLAMGEFESAVDCHTQHLRLARRLGNQVEEARAYSNLGSSHHYRRNFQQAITFHENVLRIAQELGDKAIEARAYAGLGHAARCAGDYNQAKKWHEKQLDMALATRDKVGEGRACSNLGIVYQLLGEHNAALKLHQAHLNIARAFQDRAGMGRAFGNMGNAHSAMGFYEQAIKYHKQELTISKEVNDRSSEASTHGNLAVAYQALGAHDMALVHYRAHLNIARELKDTAGEACALLNLANCLSSRQEFSQAVPYYENYLMLSQELHDIEGEAKACHFLGYAHYCLGNFREAVRYYDQDLALAKDLQDKMNMGRGYCNLGLAHLALGNLETALECQKYFLAIAHMTKHLPGKFRGLGNIGDVLIKMGDIEEAIKMFQRQLAIARHGRDRSLEAAAYGALGLAHRMLRCYDKALGYHTQELSLRQEMGELKGECRAHGNLGAVHMALANYTHAIKCYQEQLERANELKDSGVQAQAFGNLGIARLNMGHYEDAIGYFEQQLATLEQLSTTTALLDKGRAFENLGDCYDALGDLEEAVKCHEQHLATALKLKSSKDQERAYRGLGHSHKRLGNLQQALVCFEKRLVVAHELNSPEAKAVAYGDLGHIHSTLGNFEQAINCLEHQISIARELKDRLGEADAACGLGQVYQQMGEHSTALTYHQMELTIAEELEILSLQARAYGNLGMVQESLGNFEEALRYQEQHLSVAAQTNDKSEKTMAYSRIHQALGNSHQAVAYFQQGLVLAEQLGRREEEAKIRHRLGLALWGHNDLEGSQNQLERTVQLLESIRREATGINDYKLSLFDLQTASYQALQRVLVALNKQEEALLIAERGRTRAFVDLMMERQTPQRGLRMDDNVINSVVNKQKASVLYYSLAAGYLYAWCIAPNKVAITENDPDREEVERLDAMTSSGSLLEHYIQSVRDSLGVEFHTEKGNEDGTGEGWPQQCLEELNDRINPEVDKTGFLRMVNRNHLFNSSNYSLSSLFSLGSVGGSVISGSASRPGSTISRRPPRQSWQGPQCLFALYQLLIAPFEDVLPTSCSSKNSGPQRELLLVLEGDLYLVPFPVLRPQSTDNTSDYLCERFSLLVIPSLTSLKLNQRNAKLALKNNKQVGGMIRNPRLPVSVTEQWGWNAIPYAEQEAEMVAEMLHTKPLIGSQASKEAVLCQIGDAECVHFATHVSWKLSAIVLAPEEAIESQPSSTRCYKLPNLSELLLTAADLLNIRLSARLVVISSCHTRDHHGWAATDGVVGLTRALLAAGAQCVLVSLWPVPDTATKILLKAFYSALLQGYRVSRALTEAMQTVQHTKHFAHPANWAGFMLVGADVRLSTKVALMGQALCELLKAPDRCRDALRVSLHLVEKSLQRIHKGQKNAMYTTQKSIENKVGSVNGWRELLMSVGFRFEPAANGIPSSVFFPQSDPDERLTQCSASLQALLGLNGTSLFALSKLISNIEVADDIIEVIRGVCAQFAMKSIENECVEIPISVGVWRVPGCHELLASLGFDLMEVGQDQVTLRTSKTANRRNIHFSLSLDSSSSLESLTSLDNVESRPRSPQGTAPPPPLPFVPNRPILPGKFNFLRGTGGAFTSYVRRRGEPDGRTASSAENNVLPSTLTSSSNTLSSRTESSIVNSKITRPGGGGESDAAFTPSPPVDTSPCLATLMLAHQKKIRNTYSTDNNPEGTDKSSNIFILFVTGMMNHYHGRPDSSSSASSATDWEGNGHGTILRKGQIPPVPLPQIPPVKKQSCESHFNSLSYSNNQNILDSEVGSHRSNTGTKRQQSSINVLDRLNVRADLNLNNEEGIMTSGKGLYYFPADEESEITPVKGLDEKLNANKKTSDVSNPTIQDQIIATQLRRLNRELTPTISDVYHERNIGLGLAPPLSKLLISNQTNNGNFRNENDGDFQIQNLDKIMTAEETDEDNMEDVGKGPWLSKSNLNLHANNTENIMMNSLISNDKKNNGGGSPCSELSKRDEGDGRSVADSQCSMSSFKKTVVLTTRNEKNDSNNDDGIYYEEDGNDENLLRNEMNSELNNKVPIPRTRTNKGPPPPVPTTRNKINN